MRLCECFSHLAFWAGVWTCDFVAPLASIDDALGWRFLNSTHSSPSPFIRQRRYLCCWSSASGSLSWHRVFRSAPDVNWLIPGLRLTLVCCTPALPIMWGGTMFRAKDFQALPITPPPTSQSCKLYLPGMQLAHLGHFDEDNCLKHGIT